MSSIGFFDTPDQADESTRVASTWVREHKLETALPNPPKITSGELVVHRRASSSPRNNLEAVRWRREGPRLRGPSCCSERIAALARNGSRGVASATRNQRPEFPFPMNGRVARRRIRARSGREARAMTMRVTLPLSRDCSTRRPGCPFHLRVLLPHGSERLVSWADTPAADDKRKRGRCRARRLLLVRHECQRAANRECDRPPRGSRWCEGLLVPVVVVGGPRFFGRAVLWELVGPGMSFCWCIAVYTNPRMPAGHGALDPQLEITGGWRSVRTVVDVGGGTGQAAERFARFFGHTNLHCHSIDHRRHLDRAQRGFSPHRPGLCGRQQHHVWSRHGDDDSLAPATVACAGWTRAFRSPTKCLTRAFLFTPRGASRWVRSTTSSPLPRKASFTES